MDEGDIIEINLFNIKNGLHLGVNVNLEFKYIAVSFIFVGIIWHYNTKKSKNNKWISFDII